ncbi:hypothetical protein BH160DRAFT_2252 [Burkholderia sp. H160]|nr:hypothetical protein BH160DRAFT_2252 [Burkholderia sp. H160]
MESAGLLDSRKFATPTKSAAFANLLPNAQNSSCSLGQRLEDKLGDRHRRTGERIDQMQKKLEAALTEHSNLLSKWWFRKRIALLDPHSMDQPRAHWSSVPDALRRGDFRSASDSLKAANELMDIVDNTIYQFETGIDRGEKQEL